MNPTDHVTLYIENQNIISPQPYINNFITPEEPQPQLVNICMNPLMPVPQNYNYQMIPNNNIPFPITSHQMNPYGNFLPVNVNMNSYYPQYFQNYEPNFYQYGVPMNFEMNNNFLNECNSQNFMESNNYNHQRNLLNEGQYMQKPVIINNNLVNLNCEDAPSENKRSYNKSQKNKNETPNIPQKLSVKKEEKDKENILRSNSKINNQIDPNFIVNKEVNIDLQNTQQNRKKWGKTNTNSPQKVKTPVNNANSQNSMNNLNETNKNPINFEITFDEKNKKEPSSLAELFKSRKGDLLKKMERNKNEIKTQEKKEKLPLTKEEILKQRKEMMKKPEFIHSKPINPPEETLIQKNCFMDNIDMKTNKKNKLPPSELLSRLAMGIKPKVLIYYFLFK